MFLIIYAGLEPAVFAVLVPNSADKPVAELIEEIMGDHEMMVSWCFLAACFMSSGIVTLPYVFLSFLQTGQQPGST